MNIKAALKYQLEDHKKSIIIFYIIILFVYMLVIASTSVAITSGKGSVSFSGMEVATAIFLFVCGLCSFMENFLMLRQNGISRRTIFASRVAVNIIVALGMAIIDRVIWVIVTTFASSSSRMSFVSLFEMVGGSSVPGMSNLLINLGGIGLSLVIYLASLFVGYFITIMFYRLSKAGKAIVGAGVPVFFTVVLPIIDSTLTRGRIGMIFSYIIIHTMGSFGKFIISSIVLSAIFAALSWVLMRKAVVRQ